jgi:hypothetical protein
VQQHNVFERSKGLEVEATTPLPHLTNLVESIDSIIGQAGLLGEKRSHKRRPEWYLIALVRQQLTVLYLRHYIKGLSWGRNRSEVVMTKLTAIASLIRNLPISWKEAKQLLTTQEATLKKKMRDAHQSLRNEHLSTLTSTTSSKINKSEIATATWRTIRYLKDSNTTSTLDQLEIPADWPPAFTPIESIASLPDPKKTHQWQTVTSPSTIEYCLQLPNCLHFGQAQVTPFAQYPLDSAIPWTADSPAVTDILARIYIPPACVPKLCATMLQQFKRTKTNIISHTLSLESFQGKIRKWQESITTSPSGPHLGRYKALFAKGIYDSSLPNEASLFTDKQAAIVKVLLRIINFCIHSGYVLQRWQVVINTMIFKDPGNFKIH